MPIIDPDFSSNPPGWIRWRLLPQWQTLRQFLGRKKRHPMILKWKECLRVDKGSKLYKPVRCLVLMLAYLQQLVIARGFHHQRLFYWLSLMFFLRRRIQRSRRKSQRRRQQKSFSSSSNRARDCKRFVAESTSLHFSSLLFDQGCWVQWFEVRSHLALRLCLAFETWSRPLKLRPNERHWLPGGSDSGSCLSPWKGKSKNIYCIPNARSQRKYVN